MPSGSHPSHSVSLNPLFPLSVCVSAYLSVSCIFVSVILYVCLTLCLSVCCFLSLSLSVKNENKTQVHRVGRGLAHFRDALGSSSSDHTCSALGDFFESPSFPFSSSFPLSQLHFLKPQDSSPTILFDEGSEGFISSDAKEGT